MRDSRWAAVWICTLVLLTAGTVRAEVYRHDLFGVSLTVPRGLTGDADLARSRDGVLSAWSGMIDRDLTVLIVEHVDDAPETATKDDVKRIADEALIGAKSDTIERETVRWRGRTLGVIVGLVKGDVGREAHAVVDVPLLDGSALRIRLSTAANRRNSLRRTLRALVATVVVRKPVR